MWDLCWEGGVKYPRLGKDVVLILAVFKKCGEKDKGLK